MSELIECAKGLCPRAATRIARYGSADGPVEHPSCDFHGAETVEELPQAAAARKHNAENTWFDRYDPPRN